MQLTATYDCHYLLVYAYEHGLQIALRPAREADIDVIRMGPMVLYGSVKVGLCA